MFAFAFAKDEASAKSFVVCGLDNDYGRIEVRRKRCPAKLRSGFFVLCRWAALLEGLSAGLEGSSYFLADIRTWPDTGFVEQEGGI